MSAPISYKSALYQLMSFLDGVTYSVADETVQFSEERLAAITADDIVHYFNFKAYGTPEPGVNDCPKLCRSSTLYYHKKAISHFMPRQNMQWDDLALRGNPSKSSAVNKVIKKVKRHEVRGTGVPTNARRAVEWQEYLNVLIATRIIFSNKQTAMIRLLAILTLQWQFIARIDDCMKLSTTTVLLNYSAPFTLYIKMVWSKNIRSERESPTQIMFASMDPIVCPLLNLAVFMETVGTEGGLLFGRSAKTAANFLKQVYSSPLFTSQRPGKLGTHSMRKGPATYASRFGCQKDWINQRGRWRGGKQQVDTYIDVFQPYPDARVAGVLCGVRGPCMYKAKAGTNVPLAFLELITPHSCTVFGPAIAHVLALPLLWAAYEQTAECNGDSHSIIPGELAGSIRSKWAAAGGDAGTNPVEKVPLFVTQNGDQLALVPVFCGVDAGRSESGEGGHGIAAAVETSEARFNNSDRDEIIVSQNHIMQQRLEDTRNEIFSMLADHKRYMVLMNTTLRRLATQPFTRVAASSSTSPVTTKTAKLSKAPRDLFVLWKEYETGLNGRKPAKHFTDIERGLDKYNYYRRHVFWEKVQQLIDRGNTSDCAIDQIMTVYGQSKSVTAVINAMKSDRSKGIERF